VTKGYWSEPELTAQALRGGWWHSEDLGFVDGQGRLHVLDRRQDVLRRSGREIFPRAIEEAVSDHPSVKEVCVVGTEEGRIVAAVALRRRSRQGPNVERFPGDLMEFLTGRIPPEELPDQIEVFEELPRSVQGKVLKREVRDALAAARR